MMLRDNHTKLEQALMKCNSCIAYKPFAHEMNYMHAPLSQTIFNKTLELPFDKNSDPSTLADACRQEYKNERPCIIMPGTKFDVYGTRHGRGYGWYDRFLSQIPQEWLRIGITDSTKFTSEKLVRQPWDEPVDWVLSYNPVTLTWDVCETLARIK